MTLKASTRGTSHFEGSTHLNADTSKCMLPRGIDTSARDTRQFRGVQHPASIPTLYHPDLPARSLGAASEKQGYVSCCACCI